jgi:hypothetical protein
LYTAITAVTAVVDHIDRKWGDRAIGALTVGLALCAWMLLRKARSSFNNRKHQTTSKGFLDYKHEAEIAMKAFPKLLGKVTLTMQKIAPAVDKHTKALRQASTTKQQIDVARDLARSLGKFSRELESTQAKYTANGRAISEGLEMWSAWVNRQGAQVDATFVDTLSTFIGTMHSSNLKLRKYIETIGANRGVTSTLDAGIDRHANALEVMYSINVQIQEACSNMLQRFKPLLQSGIKQLSEGH